MSMVHYNALEINTIGIIGVVLVLLAYFLLQINKINQNRVVYSLMNLLGSGLILISLYFTWNLPSGIIEFAWLLISLLGLIKVIYLKKESSGALRSRFLNLRKPKS
ncbi:CBU_0592 family membrane protein [Coxiella burnetii]|uniref:CBU_0592 family membrane protein n=1 Tax=Coxiella burnetii TaxID=777 RepID=UPI00223282A0